MGRGGANVQASAQQLFFGTRRQGQRPSGSAVAAAMLARFDTVINCLEIDDEQVAEIFQAVRPRLIAAAMTAAGETSHAQRLSMLNSALDSGRDLVLGPEANENGRIIFADDALNIAAAVFGYLDEEQLETLTEEQLFQALASNWPDEGRGEVWVLEHIPLEYAMIHREWPKLAQT